MKELRAESIAIIGGADGPTSIYVEGNKKRIPLKHRIKNRIYRWKRKQAAGKIKAGARSLAEVIAYAQEKYRATEAEVSIDFRIYEIDLGTGRMELEFDYCRKVFGVSYSGSRKAMREMKRIAKDLHLYYGVSETDIREKTERYHSLLAILSM